MASATTNGLFAHDRNGKGRLCLKKTDPHVFVYNNWPQCIVSNVAVGLLGVTILCCLTYSAGGPRDQQQYIEPWQRSVKTGDVVWNEIHIIGVTSYPGLDEAYFDIELSSVKSSQVVLHYRLRRAEWRPVIWNSKLQFIMSGRKADSLELDPRSIEFAAIYNKRE